MCLCIFFLRMSINVLLINHLLQIEINKSSNETASRFQYQHVHYLCEIIGANLIRLKLSLAAQRNFIRAASKRKLKKLNNISVWTCDGWHFVAIQYKFIRC